MIHENDFSLSCRSVWDWMKAMRLHSSLMSIRYDSIISAFLFHFHEVNMSYLTQLFFYVMFRQFSMLWQMSFPMLNIDSMLGSFLPISTCDAPNPGGPIDHHQPAKYLCLIS